MFGSIIAATMLICMVIYKEPTYAVATGLFELSSVIYSITRPRRFKIKEVNNNG